MKTLVYKCQTPGCNGSSICPANIDPTPCGKCRRLNWVLEREVSPKSETIASIRRHITDLGFDASALTDEDIEAGALAVTQSACRFGITKTDAAKAILHILSAGRPGTR